MPLQSTACQPCKTRRLKCDGNLPVCNRCAKFNRSCQGGRQAFSEIFIENPYASGRKKRPRGPRANSAIHYPSNRIVSLPRLPADLQTEAITYFLHCHMKRIEEAPSMLGSVINDTPLLLNEGIQCRALELAVSSISLALFARTRKSSPAAVQASISYHKLLKMLQIDLVSLDQDNLESYLLTIIFMTLYEDAVHQPESQQGLASLANIRHLPHLSGVVAVLKYWKQHVSSTKPATGVIKHSRRSVIKMAMIRDFAIPEWLTDGETFGERGLDLEYDIIAMRIVKNRRKMADLKEKLSAGENVMETLAEAEILDEEAQGIDESLKEWKERFPKTWQRRQHTKPDGVNWTKEHFLSSTVFSHGHPSFAAVWLRYYSNRMIINNTRITLLGLCKRTDERDHQIADCMLVLEVMANDVAATIPFCFGRYQVDSSTGEVILTTSEAKPYLTGLIISPLTISSSIRCIPAGQKSWFKSQLVILGREMGYGIFESALTSNWVEM